MGDLGRLLGDVEEEVWVAEQRSTRIKNINTCSDEVLRDFDAYVEMATKKLGLAMPIEYRNGFRDGLRALQNKFLKECPGLRVEEFV